MADRYARIKSALTTIVALPFTLLVTAYTYMHLRANGDEWDSWQEEIEEQ